MLKWLGESLFVLGGVLFKNGHCCLDFWFVVPDPAEGKLALNVVDMRLIKHRLRLKNRLDLVHVKFTRNHEMLQEGDAILVGVVWVKALQYHGIVGRTKLAIILHIRDVKGRETLPTIHIILREMHVKKTDKVAGIIFVGCDCGGEV
jgi:hypothetical protein